MGALNTQLEANTQALSRAQQDKAFNESLLSQQEASWKASGKGKNPESAEEEQLRVLQDQSIALESRYTAEHPDVIKTKRQINDLTQQMAEERNASGTSTQTRSELSQMQQHRH